MAHVGIAMARGGTDVALEAADVALMSDDLTRLPFAIELGRATRAMVRQTARPTPAPRRAGASAGCALLLPGSPRWKASNTRSRHAGAMPGPRSRTASRI